MNKATLCCFFVESISRRLRAGGKVMYTLMVSTWCVVFLASKLSRRLWKKNCSVTLTSASILGKPKSGTARRPNRVGSGTFARCSVGRLHGNRVEERPKVVTERKRFARRSVFCVGKGSTSNFVHQQQGSRWIDLMVELHQFVLLPWTTCTS